MTLLDEGAYDGVSIAAVTRRASVTRSAFYFHFDSLGAAVASLMERLFDEFTELAADWYAHGGTSQIENFQSGMSDTVALWRDHAVVMDAMMRAATSDAFAAQILDEWISEFSSRALPVVRADACDLDTSVERVVPFLVAMTFDAMRRDVRRIVEKRQTDQGVAEVLAIVWVRTIYGAG